MLARLVATVLLCCVAGACSDHAEFTLRRQGSRGHRLAERKSTEAL